MAMIGLAFVTFLSAHVAITVAITVDLRVIVTIRTASVDSSSVSVALAVTSTVDLRVLVAFDYVFGACSATLIVVTPAISVNLQEPLAVSNAIMMSFRIPAVVALASCVDLQVVVFSLAE